MQRFKITPEVIAKGVASFLFGALVGFCAFRLVTRFSPNFVSAFTRKNDFYEEETPDFSSPDEKTVFPLELKSLEEKENLSSNENTVNVSYRKYPVIKPIEEDKEDPASDSNLELRPTDSSTKTEAETSAGLPTASLDEPS